MEKINIASKLVSLRRELGITQDKLATHLGVTKASVSKWETGSSLPDVLLLPKIAAFYGVSVDELLGYVTELDKKEIKSIHSRLSEAFFDMPFSKAFAMCEEVVRDNYSCFPMLLKVAEIYINNFDRAVSSNKKKELLDRVVKLTGRIQEFSSDDVIRSQAKTMEAVVLLTRGEGDKVLEMYGEECQPLEMVGDIVSRAMCLKGEREKAKETMQIYAYQYLIALINELSNLIPLYPDDFPMQEEIVRRINIIYEAFNAKHLNPNPLAVTYYTIAQNYCMAGNMEKALEYVEEYFKLKPYFKVLGLRGDEFFNKIDRWLEKNTVVPRSQKDIMVRFETSISENPIFKVLEETEDYKGIKEKYKDA